MEVSKVWFFALLILMAIFISWQKEKLESSDDICRLFKDGVKLRKPGTCNEGIICENFLSTPYIACSNKKPWYTLDSSSCVAKQPTDSYCKVPCKNSSATFVVDSKNCHNWYQCSGTKEIHKGSCPINMLFNETQQMCTYSDQTKCESTYNFCDVVPANVPFADEKNCHKYQQCKRGSITSVTCPTGKYFDKALGECTNKANVECYKHPYPNEVCGNSKIALRNKFVRDQATCRGYFYCQDLGAGKPDPSPYWGQCPVEEFFNPVLQACQLRSYVKCDEDRCDGSSLNEFEISNTLGCQHYLVCGNNYTIAEIYCGNNKYFDVETNQCTTEKKSYPACNY